MYTVFDSPDALKSTFKALKDAGITYLVLLSSYAVKDPPSSTDTTEIVPRIHSQTEISLNETEGLKAAILRPPFFATNAFLFAQGIKQGKLDLFHPNAVFDFIVPEDIGAVAG